MIGSDRELIISPKVTYEVDGIFKNMRKSIDFGVMLGIVIAMCVYNFFIFLNLRDFSYLWYVVIHVSALVFMVTTQWNPLINIPYQGLFATLAINVAGIGWCLFTKSVLDTRNQMPRSDKLLTFLVFLFIVLTVAGPVALPGMMFSSLAQLLNLGAMTYGFVLSVMLSFKGGRTARLLCAAWLFTIFLFAFNNLPGFGLLEMGTREVFNLGAAVASILMSLVLAFRIKVLREERISVQAATDARSAFLSTMSHEIRTPMTAIMGYSRLLQDLDLPDQGRRYLKNVQSAADHLLGIINDILDLSKIEAGRMTLEEKEFSLDQLLEDVVRFAAPKAGENRNELLCIVDDRLPTMLVGDPHRVRQILANLLSNAVKFTKDGEVRLEVAADTGSALPDASSTVLRITVSDTGIGIPKAQQGRLFEAFAQADESMSRKHGGTGLGLIISRRLTRMMGGDLGFVSTPGEGSSFTSTIRLGVAQPQPPQPCRLPELGPGYRALVADDNASARAVLADLLRRAGADVEMADSGFEALERLRKTPDTFAAVFLDREMPGMDGIEVAHIVHDEGLLKGRPVILVAPIGTPEPDPADLARIGVRTILVKPVSRAGLRSVLAELVEAWGGEVECPQQDSGQDKDACRGKRVLLVDDNEFNLDVLESMLSVAGVEVVTAANGRDALDILALGPAPDAVLLDIQMPGMDGYEVARRIRENVQWLGLPVLAVTANVVKGERERCLAAGMNGYLTKPVDASALFRALARWTRKREDATY